MSLVKMLLLECENWILGKPLVSISTGGFLLPFLQSYFIKEVDKVTGFIVLVAYTLLMLGVSYLLTRRQTTLQGFLVGDRRMGTIKSAMSIAATWIWAPALFVSAEKAYSNGWPCLLYTSDAADE